MTVQLQEVYAGSGVDKDEHNRMVSKPSKYVRMISVNPTQVVAVEPLAGMVVESLGNNEQETCRVVTNVGSYTVLGSRSVVERKLFGDQRKVLKG